MTPKISEFEMRGLMDLKQISKQVQGVSISLDYLYKLTGSKFSGTRVRQNVSRPAAEELERITGVCREAWVWPERHYNPYMWKVIHGIKPGYCACCVGKGHKERR